METLDDKINFGYAFLSAAFIIWYPFFILLFLRRQKEEDLLHDKNLSSVYGAIFEGCKLQRKRGISYYFMFTLRRLLYAWSLVYLDHNLVFQIIVNFALSITMIIYIGKWQPWEIQFNNNLEQFNEFSCLVLQYH